jgi:putative aldouronate transport system permease protein
MDQDALALLPPLETIRAATIIFTTLPILCVYPFLQKHFAQGIMVGSLKG